MVWGRRGACKLGLQLKASGRWWVDGKQSPQGRERWRPRPWTGCPPHSPPPTPQEAALASEPGQSHRPAPQAQVVWTLVPPQDLPADWGQPRRPQAMGLAQVDLILLLFPAAQPPTPRSVPAPFPTNPTPSPRRQEPVPQRAQAEAPAPSPFSPALPDTLLWGYDGSHSLALRLPA